MGLNLDKVRENRAKAKEEASRRNANFYQFQNGRNLVRILPPWAGSDDFARPMGKHWNLGPEGNISVFCPKECAGMPCPICEELDRIWKTKPDEATKEWLRTVGASRRYYVNLIDLNDMDKGVQIGELPKTVLEEIWNIMVDEDTGLGDITDWKDGYDLIIEKTGKGLSTRYGVRAKRAPTAISQSEYEDKLINLDAFVKTESYADLKLIWEGKTSSSSGALPAPEGAPSRTPARTPVSTSADDADVVEGEATEVTEKVSAGLPACFGSFNEEMSQCLDCPEQDECEAKMLAERSKAAEAGAKDTGFDAAVVVAPAAEAAPAESSGELDTDALMAEMEAAIKG